MFVRELRRRQRTAHSRSHGQRLMNDSKHLFRLGRLDDDVMDAARFRELP